MYARRPACRTGMAGRPHLQVTATWAAAGTQPVPPLNLCRYPLLRFQQIATHTMRPPFNLPVAIRYANRQPSLTAR